MILADWTSGYSLRDRLFRPSEVPEDHPPVDLHSPSESAGSSPPRSASVPKNLMLPATSSHEVFFPTALTVNGNPLLAGLPSPLCSALRVTALSTVYFSRYPPALFHADQRSWDSPFRAFPSNRIRCPCRTVRYPPAVIVSRFRRLSGRPGNRGTRLDFRVLIPCRSTSPIWRGLPAFMGRCSPGLSSSPGFSPFPR